MNIDAPDFPDMYRRFDSLPSGATGPMRRVAEPAKLRDTPGLYRLFPGARPDARQVRAAFILPWCPALSGGKELQSLCADTISEARIIQVARARPPDDLIALRRIVMQLRPALGWLQVASLAWFWGTKEKREFVEKFFIALHKLDKGANS